MKKFICLICMLLFTACSMHRQKLTWRVKDMARSGEHRLSIFRD